MWGKTWLTKCPYFRAGFHCIFLNSCMLKSINQKSKKQGRCGIRPKCAWVISTQQCIKLLWNQIGTMKSLNCYHRHDWKLQISLGKVEIRPKELLNANTVNISISTMSLHMHACVTIDLMLIGTNSFEDFLLVNDLREACRLIPQAPSCCIYT